VPTSQSRVFRTGTDTGAGTTTRNATVTLLAAAPALVITPAVNIVTSGDQGGPFTPNLFTYTIKAQSGTINWVISGCPSWLTPSATSGAATTTGSQVSFTVNANSQAVGNYPATITFTNSDTGSGTTTRAATLTVTTVATPGALPGNPLGHWQLGTYSPTNQVVANLVGGTPTPNKFRMPRRNFGGNGVGIPWLLSGRLPKPQRKQIIGSQGLHHCQCRREC
jgi:hypothetical protein